MAYSVALLVHTYLRWIVLTAGIVVLVRSVSGWLGAKPYTKADNGPHVGFISVLDIQLLVGLALYAGLSPITAAFFANPKASMKISQVRFFGVEHITMMLIAVVLVHIARRRGKNLEGPARHKLTALTTLVWLLLTVASIPWPGMPWGRPLYR